MERGAKYCDFHVCLSVRQPPYLKNDMSERHEISFACYLWLWLGSPQMTMQYVITSGFVDDVMFSHN